MPDAYGNPTPDDLINAPPPLVGPPPPPAGAAPPPDVSNLPVGTGGGPTLAPGAPPDVSQLPPARAGAPNPMLPPGQDVLGPMRWYQKLGQGFKQGWGEPDYTQPQQPMSKLGKLFAILHGAAIGAAAGSTQVGVGNAMLAANNALDQERNQAMQQQAMRANLQFMPLQRAWQIYQNTLGAQETQAKTAQAQAEANKNRYITPRGGGVYDLQTGQYAPGAGPTPAKETGYKQQIFDDLTSQKDPQLGRPLTDIEALQRIETPPEKPATDEQETYSYRTKPKAQGGLGETPAQAWSAMHPRAQSSTVPTTADDIESVAQAIINGDQPPTLTGMYRNSMAVRAALAHHGFPLARATQDWQAAQQYIRSLNSAQQLRLRQAITTASDSLDKIQSLYDQWQQTGLPSGYKIWNRAALRASANLPGNTGAIAQALQTQIADLTSEMGQVYMGGNTPTDHSLGLAAQNLNGEWNKETFAEAMKQARINLQIRNNSITHSQPMAMTPGSPYTPSNIAGPTGGTTPPPNAPPAIPGFAEIH